jgi:hypothetical protein
MCSSALQSANDGLEDMAAKSDQVRMLSDVTVWRFTALFYWIHRTSYISGLLGFAA